MVRIYDVMMFLTKMLTEKAVSADFNNNHGGMLLLSGFMIPKNQFDKIQGRNLLTVMRTTGHNPTNLKIEKICRDTEVFTQINKILNRN